MRPSLLALVALLATATPAGAASLEIALAFRGAGGGYPPDTMGAVGPAHVLEVTNAGIHVHRKSDGEYVEGGSLSEFWSDAGVATYDTFDPRAIYDPASGRFFVVALNGRYTSNEILLAVSRSDDPTEGFDGWAFDSDSTDATWADFPTIGVDGDTVTIASDMHQAGVAGGLPISVDVLVVPKADLLAVPPSIDGATLFERAALATTGFAPQPVTRLEGEGRPGWMLSTAVAFVGTVQTTRIGGSASAPTLTAGPFLSVTPMPTPPDALQTGAGLLDTGDGHVASPVQIGDAIWAVHCAQGATGRAAIRWLELDAVTLAVRQEGVLESDALDYLYPSIAANAAGHVVIGFSASGPSLPPSSFAALGETHAGTTLFGEPIAVLAGTGDIQIDSVSRFGDYSATVLDPSDPTRFWSFQEIGGDGGGAAIAIAALRVVPEPSSAAAQLAALLVLVRRRTRRQRRRSRAG